MPMHNAIALSGILESLEAGVGVGIQEMLEVGIRSQILDSATMVLSTIVALVAAEWNTRRYNS